MSARVARINFEKLHKFDSQAVLIAGKIIDVNVKSREALLDTSDGKRVTVCLIPESILPENVGKIVEVTAQVIKSEEPAVLREFSSIVHSGTWSPEAYNSSISVAHRYPGLFGW